MSSFVASKPHEAVAYWGTLSLRGLMSLDLVDFEFPVFDFFLLEIMKIMDNQLVPGSKREMRI